jgi:uncharacterized protein YndB with AHSA1/START domain
MSASDSVRVTIRVAVALADAFEIFTADIDAWWRRGSRFRVSGNQRSTLRFEGGAGGRLVETWGDSPDERFEHGEVLVWDPPKHLRFELRGRAFAPGEHTWVDVRFEPDGDATRVTLENGGFDAFPAGHPLRHGAEGVHLVSMMGRWWLELLRALAAAAATRDGRPPR